MGPFSIRLVSEVSHPGENHGHLVLISGVDYFLVANRSARLDDGSDAGLSSRVQPIAEREKGVRGHYTALNRKDRFHAREFHGIDATHLSGPDADRLAGSSVDNGVGLTCLQTFQANAHAAYS